MIDPQRVAAWVPAWLAPYLIRVGLYLQAMGRECYHQCDQDKQCTMKAKLAKVYDGHEN